MAQQKCQGTSTRMHATRDFEPHVMRTVAVLAVLKANSGALGLVTSESRRREHLAWTLGHRAPCPPGPTLLDFGYLEFPQAD